MKGSISPTCLHEAFLCTDPQSAKKTVKISMSFCTFEIWSQFDQHFIRTIFVQKQIEQLFFNYVPLCNFLTPNYWQKCDHKMLMKLTPGVNFINVPHAAFTRADPECAKNDSQVSSVFLRFWDLLAKKLLIKFW